MTDEELIAALRDAADWHAGRHVAHLTTQAADRLSALSPRVVADEVDGGWLIHKAGRGWYRPNAQGYTNDTAQAGRYSHEDAHSYSHPNGWDGPRDGITIKHESELQSLRTAALSSAGKKEGPEVVGYADPEALRTQHGWFDASQSGDARFTVPLITIEAANKAIADVKKDRDEAWSMAREYQRQRNGNYDRAEAAEALNAELVKALDEIANGESRIVGEIVTIARAALGGQSNE